MDRNSTARVCAFATGLGTLVAPAPGPLGFGLLRYLTYDVARDRLVGAGDRTGGRFGALYEWDDTTWIVARATPNLVTQEPVYDDARTRVLAVGSHVPGWQDTPLHLATCDGHGFVDVGPTPGGTPTSWTFGSARNRLIGFDPQGTYEGDGQTSFTPPTAATRQRCRLVYDDTRGEVFANGATMAAWNGSAWPPRAAPPGVSAAAQFLVASDPRHTRVLAYDTANGTDGPVPGYDGIGTVDSDECAGADAVARARRSTSTAAVSSSSASMRRRSASDSTSGMGSTGDRSRSRDRVPLVGGIDGTPPPQRDHWEFDGTNWSLVVARVAFSTSLPDAPTLRSVTLHAQGAVADPGSPLGIAMNQGLELRLGH